MIFSLQDGKRFYQWDRERVLLVLNDEVNQVHFTNDRVTNAIVKDVYIADGARVVDVPSVLLQHACNLTAYAYITENEEREYTLLHEEFRILARKQPDDYIPPEEHDRWVDLKADVLRAADDAQRAAEEATASVITKTEIVNDELIITYADGSSVNTGRVKGDQGEIGETGPKGEKGDTGNGVDVTDDGAGNVFVHGGTGSGGGIAFETDETLTLENGVLSVNTADAAEPDNTLPITSAAVAAQVGNIEILLATI